MNFIHYIIVVFLLSVATWLPMQAQHSPSEEEVTVKVDDSDSDLRENPDEAAGEWTSSDIEDDNAGLEPYPSFTHQLGIEMNGRNWEHLRSLLANPAATINILHIGDSHLQADIATNVLRNMLQMEFGNAGRGLVAPLRLSGTNEPYNYAFRSDIPWRVERFMKHPWINRMGFTGCSLYSPHPNGYIELSTSERDDYNPFSLIALYYDGDLNVDRITDEDGSAIGFSIKYTVDGCLLRLSGSVRFARLDVSSSTAVTLYGASLLSNHPGVTYNVIGNNGAAFSSYNRVDGFAESARRAVNPDLVIISLGTNEAFGTFNSLQFVNQVNNLVSDIRRFMPDAAILLTTPIECHRRITTGRGRRRRTSYIRNEKVAQVRSALISYGKKNNVPVYDFYAAAGGEGASDKWINAGLYSRDHIHLSAKGYHLMGRMLFDALLPQLKQDNILNSQ